MSASNYLEDAILDHVLGGAALTQPTPYLSLHTASPGEADDGANELAAANGYAREAITFAAASGGSKSNSAAVEFTASGADWSAASHFGVYDAATDGNLLYHGSLTAAKTVTDGDTLTFAIGDITITAD